MSLLSTDIARLIHHHLLKEGYESSANNLISECPHLKGLKPVKQPYKLPRLLGLSLADLFESYFETKENVIEELELLESVVFREHDSLPFLTKTLVENLKSPTHSKTIQKGTCSIGVNTELEIKTGTEACNTNTNTQFFYVPECCDASVNTDQVLLPENCDACTNTDSLYCPQTCDSSVNTDLLICGQGTCDACVNSEVSVVAEETNNSVLLSFSKPDVLQAASDNSVNNMNNLCTQENFASNDVTYAKPLQVSETLEVQDGNCDADVNPVWNQQHAVDQENDHGLYCSEQLVESTETVAFSLVYDRLLENREFQEKIAENINKKKAQVVLPHTDSSKVGSMASSQDLDTVIKAIVAETQADPAFDNFLKDCIGIDSEDQTSVGTPDSVAPHDGESNIAPDYSENQKNFMVSDDLGEPMLVGPPLIPSSFFTLQNSDVIGSSLINTLNSVAIVTSSGQITLVPTVISAIPNEAGSSETVSSTVTKKVRKKQIMVSRKAPVRIAPKPIFTLTIPAPDCDYDQLPVTAYEAGSALVEHDTVENNENQNQQQSLDPDLLTIETNESSPGPSKVKPIMKIKHRHLAKSRRTKNLKIHDPTLRRPRNPPPPEKNLTSNLAALLKIAEEYRSSTMDVPDQQTIVRTVSSESPDVIFSTPVPDASGFVTTPTSTRRRSHVRQLNFGESPEFSGKPAGNIPAIQSKRSEIPWDLALRNAFASPPPADSEIFATPKGKAKRKRKSSPIPVKIDAVVTPEISSSDETFRTSPSILSHPPAQASFTNMVPADQTAIPATVMKEAPQPCETSSAVYADLVAASILHEMANTPIVEVIQREISTETIPERMVTQCVSTANLPQQVSTANLPPQVSTANLPPQVSTANLPQQVSTANLIAQFGAELVSCEDHVAQHFTLPVLATPRKAITDTIIGSYPTHSVPSSVLCDGQSNSVSFGSWEGEIPRTPQIRMDLTSSTSPFQVSLTKGFRFLPAADSPSLAVPSTPCILEAGNSNTSIETPYTGFYQFPSLLSTPRLEALRQEVMESPGNKSLSLTVISPTQVVLGRPTPYFIPSGERAQGPVMNQIATPEHIPETDKLDRTRRCSTEMDPLQLEESNDASDAAAALMCKAAENVAAALHPPTPYKTDQILENDLINECHRLEDVPSVEKTKQRNQRLIDLFGEDSSNLGERTSTIPSAPETVMEVALAQSTPVITKQTTRKTALKKPIHLDDSVSAGCARVQFYPKNPQASRRRSQRRSNFSKESTSLENETIIQELLAISRLNDSHDPVKQSPLRKRRRKSDPLNRKKFILLEKGDTQKKSTQKQSNMSGFTDTVIIEASTSMNEFPSVSCASPTSSSTEEVNVVELIETVELPLEDRRKTGRSKQTKKEREKPATRRALAKACSSNSFGGMVTRKTPVKLFKSAPPPYTRKAISYRQSTGVKKTPKKVSRDELASAVSIRDKDANSERDSIEEVDMPATVPLADGIQSIEDLVKVVESDCLPTDKFVTSPMTDIAEDVDVPSEVMERTELLVATETSTQETAALEGVSDQPSATSPMIPVEHVPVESMCETLESANEPSATDMGEKNVDAVVSPENNKPVAVSTQEDSPGFSANSLTLSNSSDNAKDFSGLCPKPISDVLGERRHNSAEVLPSISLETEPSNTTKIVLSYDNVEMGTKESSLSSETILNLPPEETLQPAEALSGVDVGVTLINHSGCLLPPDDRVVKSNQKLSSSNFAAAKEKTNRSNSKLQNYLRLSSFDTTSDICSSKRKPSRSDATILSIKSSSAAHPTPPAIPVHSQLPPQETTVFMHKDLVNKIRKHVMLSKEVDLYSQ